MKNHSNRILTVFFAVSLVVSISLFLVRAVAFPFEIYGAVEILRVLFSCRTVSVSTDAFCARQFRKNG